jgi:hypothetical protein
MLSREPAAEPIAAVAPASRPARVAALGALPEPAAAAPSPAAPPPLPVAVRALEVAAPAAPEPVAVAPAVPAAPEPVVAPPVEPAPAPVVALLTVGGVQASLDRCFRSALPASSSVQIQLASTLRFRLAADGAVVSARFDPPLKPELQACATPYLSGRFAAGSTSVDVPVSIKQ